jgi:S1-C subfamily serine protease
MMRVFFSLLCILPLTSCYVAPTPLARVDRRPPSAESLYYAQQRMSAVIVTKQADISAWVRRGFPKSQTPPDTDGGTACPISPDGYFLTADHVLKNARTSTVHVLYGRGSGLQIAQARIVWRDARNDIAIFHAPLATPAFYAFTSPALPIPEGTTVFHGGLTTGLKPLYGALNTTIPAQSMFTGAKRFRIDIPLQPGDSGGPILDARAQLIGINSSVEFLIPMETPIFTESSGVRPNVGKVMKIIANDRRR